MNKSCPNCNEEYILGESVLAELIPSGPNGTFVDGSEGVFKEYAPIGAYYYHANGKLCVKDCARVVELEEPIFRTLREPVQL